MSLVLDDAHAETPAPEYLRGLATRIMHISALQGVDQYDVDRLTQIARDMEDFERGDLVPEGGPVTEDRIGKLNAEIPFEVFDGDIPDYLKNLGARLHGRSYSKCGADADDTRRLFYVSRKLRHSHELKEDNRTMSNMDKTADRAVDALARIANALETIAEGMNAPAEAPVEDAKPAPKKPSKAKAAPKPKETQAEETQAEETPDVSAQDLRAKLIEVMQSVDKQSAVSIVDKYAGKGGKMGDIPDDKRALAFAEAEELLSL